jgi:alkanesulfonate monooxygenase SsuD/methylene tetrahydromethanopterin reductase-like flavin-dependent oxidoreductase (luciferase family)
VPPPVRDFDKHLDPQAIAILADSQSQASVGSPETVRQGLEALIARTHANELMITANIFDHDKRKRSFEIVAEIHGGMRATMPLG